MLTESFSSGNYSSGKYIWYGKPATQFFMTTTPSLPPCPHFPQSPALLKAKEELSRLIRSIRSGQKAVMDKEKQVGEQERKLAQLQTVLKEVKAGEREGW